MHDAAAERILPVPPILQAFDVQKYFSAMTMRTWRPLCEPAPLPSSFCRDGKTRRGDASELVVEALDELAVARNTVGQEDMEQLALQGERTSKSMGAILTCQHLRAD
eukprot:763588-Hanusia_phi.AAC.2